jgi:hypothetical protein
VRNGASPTAPPRRVIDPPRQASSFPALLAADQPVIANGSLPAFMAARASRPHLPSELLRAGSEALAARQGAAIANPSVEVRAGHPDECRSRGRRVGGWPIGPRLGCRRFDSLARSVDAAAVAALGRGCDPNDALLRRSAVCARGAVVCRRAAGVRACAMPAVRRVLAAIRGGCASVWARASGSIGALDGACESDARCDAHLFEDVTQVGLDRLFAEEQLRGDLWVGLAVDD